MTDNIPWPSPIDLSGGNVVDNWNYFKAQWKNYAIASGLNTKDDEVQVATFLCAIGRSAFDVYNTLNLSTAVTGNTDGIIAALDGYFKPKVNVIYERAVFNSISQAEGENIDSFLTKLRRQAEKCNFKCPKCKDICIRDEMVRDRLVAGILSQDSKKKLISDSALTLRSAIDQCKADELADAQVTQMNSSSCREEAKDISKVTRTAKVNNKQVITCIFCGEEHVRDKSKCPAYGKTCTACKKSNHFASVCQNKKNKTKRRVRAVEAQNSDENNSASEDDFAEAFSIATVGRISSYNQGKLLTNIGLTYKNYCCQAQCQIDTGASVDVISLSDVKRLCNDKTQEFKPSKVKLKCFSGKIVEPIGELALKVSHGKSTRETTFQVIKQKCTPILSASTSIGLGLIAVQSPLLQVSAAEDPILSKYKDLFTGLGCLEGDLELQIEIKAVPIKQTRRRVPIPLRATLKEKLDELTTKGVIAPVTEPTEWISNLVLVKSPKKLRICLDPLHLNKALKRAEYEMPTLDEILPCMKGARVFSVFDTQNGFWHIKLTRKSSMLTTFWTPFGRYRWLRLPFGLANASEEYQRRLHEIFNGLNGVELICDDAIIMGFGDTDEEAIINHDENLNKFLEKAREANIRFNKSKVKLRMHSVEYMGHIISHEGLKADPQKIKALVDMPEPTDVSTLRTFLGLITYLSRFLPDLASVADSLRRLTCKNQEWCWGAEQQAAFSKLKKMCAATPVLQFFDVSKPAVIQADASSTGLGAVLLQESKPVAFASRSLSSAERHYAQIEKETLAVVFATERFEQYILGKTDITVQSDHKPLEAIFQRPIVTAPKRLQRMLLRLQKFTFKLTYLRGSAMYIADALSRLSLPIIKHKDFEEVYHVDEIYEELENYRIADNIDVLEQTILKVKQATSQDKLLQELASFIHHGWPAVKVNLPPELHPYWSLQSQLMIQDGVIYSGDKVVVPASLRKEFLKKIHVCHVGPDACLRRARDTLFWPFMSHEIKDFISQCEVCSTFNQSQTKESMQSHRLPSYPWERIAMDIFTYEHKDYLVTVDFYSDFFELDHLCDMSAQTIVQICKKNFSRHGIPRVVITDNAPSFVNGLFKIFSTDWNFTHSTSSPYHSKGNGKAESAVKIAKVMLKKCSRGQQDIWDALLQWRNSPSQGVDFSPVQRLMSRRTRTQLPTSSKLLMPYVPENITAKLMQKRQVAKKYYDKGAQDLPKLQTGQEVWIQPQNRSGIQEWSKGRVTSQRSDRSYEVEAGGTTYRRNRVSLKPRTTDYKSPTPATKAIAEEENTPALSTRQATPRVVNTSPGNDRNGQRNVQRTEPECSTPVKTTRGGRTIKAPKKLDL